MLIIFLLNFIFLSNLSIAQRVIKIDPDKNAEEKQIKLSEIASGIKYVKLETNNSCFISQIVKLITDDSHIFISSYFKDYTRLLMFSKNGNFIREIGVYGKGPGEYMSVDDFTLNSEEKLIYILDPLGKILIYNYSGDYLKTIKLEARPSNLLYYNKKLWLFSAWPDYYLNNGYCILVFPPENPEKKIYLLNRKRIAIKRTPNSLIYPNFHFSINSDKSVSFFEEKFDTLYYIDSQFKVTPKFVIELKNDLPLNLSTYNDYKLSRKTHNSLFDFIEVNDFLLFSVITPNPIKKYFYAVSKSSGKIFRHDMTYDDLQIINDLDLGVPVNLRGYSSPGVLYSSIDCYKLKEFLEKMISGDQYRIDHAQFSRLSALVNKADISANPLLIFITLK